MSPVAELDLLLIEMDRVRKINSEEFFKTHKEKV
jgi:hypothetical protein